MKKINYYLLFICIVLFSCATNTIRIRESNQINSKTSILSDDDAKECMQYSSWQSDYWKEKIIDVVYIVICI